MSEDIIDGGTLPLTTRIGLKHGGVWSEIMAGAQPPDWAPPPTIFDTRYGGSNYDHATG